MMIDLATVLRACKRERGKELEEADYELKRTTGHSELPHSSPSNVLGGLILVKQPLLLYPFSIDTVIHSLQSFSA